MTEWVLILWVFSAPPLDPNPNKAEDMIVVARDGFTQYGCKKTAARLNTANSIRNVKYECILLEKN